MPIAINGSGTITGVSVGGLPDGIVDTDMIANGAVTAAKRGAGAILQVVSTTKTDVYSEQFGSIGEGSNITGFSVSITPSSSSNKVLLTGFMSVGTSGTSEHCLGYRIYRGSTLISVGDTDGNRGRVTGSSNFGNGGNRAPDNVVINHLDSPSTSSSVTYNIRFYHQYATGTTLYLNRGGNGENNNGRTRATSTITAMEVAA